MNTRITHIWIVDLISSVYDSFCFYVIAYRFFFQDDCYDFVDFHLLVYVYFTRLNNPNCFTVTPVEGLSFWGLGFEKIFKTQDIFKTQKSALLVLWKGIINPPLQSLVNQYFSQREEYQLTQIEQLFSKKNHEN